MTTPWRIVDLTEFNGEIYAGQGHLKVGDQNAALDDVIAVLFGTKCLIHSSVFDRAAAYGVVLLHCNWAFEPLSATSTWSDNSRVAARQIAQANLEVPRQKNAWMRIVKAKIKGQAYNMRAIGDAKAFKYLFELAESTRSGDPANNEGQAARYYWRRIFSDTSFRRLPGSKTPFNSQLNYGYTILRARVLRSILEAGLWPTMGIWHSNRSNTFALADDLIEPFRPAVDLIVRSTGGRDMSRETKKDLAGVLELTLRSSEYTLSSEVTKFCQRFANYVEGKEKFLSVPVFGGEYEEA